MITRYAVKVYDKDGNYAGQVFCEQKPWQDDIIDAIESLGGVSAEVVERYEYIPFA